MEYNKIEQRLISSIAEDDPHKVSKQLQIKQWAKLYGDKLLRSSLPDELDFIIQVISKKECWDEVDELEGVQLNRSNVGRKLLASETPNGGKNPFEKIQKYKIACWCCFEDKIKELGNQLLIEKNIFGHGLLVTYWTYVKFIKSDGHIMSEFYMKYRLRGYPLEVENNEELHYGFQSAIRDNNKESLEYFWNKLVQATYGQCQQQSLNEMNKNDLLIYTATHYCLPFSKANNEKVAFVMDHLDQQQYAKLLEKDFERNKQYSTLYNLISNFEFDKAKKLAEKLPENTLDSHYDDLRNFVRQKISSLALIPPKFHVAGDKLLDSLKMPSNSSSQRSDNILHNTEVITLDQTTIEKARKRISSYGDDSSDEEDTVMSYDNKTALAKLRDFHQTRSTVAITSNCNSSFIAHAVSIKLLYSSNIQKGYYLRKPKYKKKFPTYDELCIAVDNSANHIVDWDSSDEFTKQEVAYDICNTINADPRSFLRALLNKTLQGFFEKLEQPKGRYNSGDLSCGAMYALELGGCPDLVSDIDGSRPKKQKSDHLESDHLEYLNGVFDISELDPQSHFPTKFFSNLRLYNRLEKRKLRGSMNYNISKTWIEWKYSDCITVKIDNKNDKAQYRADWVQFGELGRASYEQIYNKVSFTMKDLEALPTIFTKGVEAVKEISSNAASLHYLLFGTEVIRNPSALIHNMMILDLIKGGHYTWKSALKDNYMPMAMTNAIVASRFINSLFNENYMPHKYLYEDKTYEEYKSNYWSPDSQQRYYQRHIQDAQDLINKEKALILAWCKMKWPEANQYFDEQSDIKITMVEWLFNKLQESCKTWYDINIIRDDSSSNA